MCFDCNWTDWLAVIAELRGEPKYGFADETLSGIEDWIVKNEHVTQDQRKAILHIQESK